MKIEELLKLSPGELVDMGICPTCFNRENDGALYGDNSDKLLYQDSDIECFFVGNPRADGHMCISTIKHYHDMSEAPDWLNEKIVRFSKTFMKIICDVYKCERVYLCTMCDGPNNHYHVQLIPRYAHEKRGSTNFVKARGKYRYDQEKLDSIRNQIAEYASKEGRSNNIGRKVRVTIDRPIGTPHPEYPELIYECNYGYVKGIIAADGEEQDAYVIGISEPIASFDGVVVAEIIRENDAETKWVVAPQNVKPTEKEIRGAINFQEKFFKIEVAL